MRRRSYAGVVVLVFVAELAELRRHRGVARKVCTPWSLHTTENSVPACARDSTLMECVRMHVVDEASSIRGCGSVGSHGRARRLGRHLGTSFVCRGESDIHAILRLHSKLGRSDLGNEFGGRWSMGMPRARSVGCRVVVVSAHPSGRCMSEKRPDPRLDTLMRIYFV